MYLHAIADTLLKSYMASLVVITGASRGFGRECCQQFSVKITEPSHFILIGRDIDTLDDTADLCRTIGSDGHQYHVFQMDFEDTESITDRMLMLTKLIESLKFDHVTVVNNGGSLGVLDRLVNPLKLAVPLSMAQISSSINTNLTSTIFFTTC